MPDAKVPAKKTEEKKPKPTIDELMLMVVELKEQNRRILRRMTWMTVANYAKFFLILVPIIVGALYLPSFIENLLGSLPSALGVGGGLPDSQINEIIQQFMK